MSLENWMNTRKIILLTEKTEKLFNLLPQTPNFHGKRAELYDTLSKMASIKRGFVANVTDNFGVPMIA